MRNPSDGSLGRSPLSRGHRGKAGSLSKQPSSPEGWAQARTQRQPDGQSTVPERSSAHRASQKGAQLAPKHHRGRGGLGPSPRGRSASVKKLQRRSSSKQSPSRHGSPADRAPKQARLHRTPTRDRAASAQASPACFLALLFTFEQGVPALHHSNASSWRRCSILALHHDAVSWHCIKLLITRSASSHTAACLVHPFFDSCS